MTYDRRFKILRRIYNIRAYTYKHWRWPHTADVRWLCKVVVELMAEKGTK